MTEARLGTFLDLTFARSRPGTSMCAQVRTLSTLTGQRNQMHAHCSHGERK